MCYFILRKLIKIYLKGTHLCITVSLRSKSSVVEEHLETFLSVIVTKILESCS